MIKIIANYQLSLGLTGNLLDKKRGQRRLNLEKKLHQYSKLCEADVYLGKKKKKKKKTTTSMQNKF
jgi:hypothetical protein